MIRFHRAKAATTTPALGIFNPLTDRRVAVHHAVAQIPVDPSVVDRYGKRTLVAG